MKSFLIKYTFSLEPSAADAWHARVREFIAAIDADPALKGRIHYRCMKAAEGNAYFHLAEVRDDAAPKELAERAWFKAYTEETKRVAGGTLEVVPLATLAESSR